jgi:membrane associated rhomboid family serine protease
MSWQHREYAPEDEYQAEISRYRGSGMKTLSVTMLIIFANVAIFLLIPVGSPAWERLALIPLAVWHGEIWRIFTATYLHANLMHIAFNMIALYFLGPALERVWGRRQFLFVYTVGGIMGYILLSLAGRFGYIDPRVPGIGASGSILTLLGAAAVLFPDATVYVYFILPVRLRTCAIIYGIWYVYNIYSKGSNFGGDMCHIAGLIFGLTWAYTGGISLSGRHHVTVNPASLLGKLGSVFRGGGETVSPGPGAWDARMKQRRDDEELIDRILAKVHDQGIQSLTVPEQEALAAATRRRREEEQRIDRM